MANNKFLGYRRENGRVGIRNHVIILPLDDLSNAACEAVANNIKGTLAIPHPYGRLQFGADLDLHFRTLIGTGCNPNVAAVIVIGIEPGWTGKVVEGIAKTGKPVEGFAIERNGDHKTIEMAPEYFLSYIDLGTAHLAMGDAEEALKWFRHGQSSKLAIRSYDAHIVRALAVLGELDEAAPIMQRLEEESKQQYVRQEVLAMGYAALGDLDRAFGCLNRALAERSAGLVYLHIDPGFDPLRGDPRYTTLVERIGVK